MIYCSINKFRLVKTGSLVKLIPSLRKPVSSPAGGMWLMCISQPRNFSNCANANAAAGFDGVLTLKAVRVSLNVREICFSAKTSC